MKMLKKLPYFIGQKKENQKSSSQPTFQKIKPPLLLFQILNTSRYRNQHPHYISLDVYSEFLKRRTGKTLQDCIPDGNIIPGALGGEHPIHILLPMRATH
ncbi:MAG: hypothetical protein ABI237_09270 [Ginsengibacter sp.]